MAVLFLSLLLGVLIFNIGLFVWVIFKHYLTIDIPPALKHRERFRLLHCIFLFVITLGTILEKMKICSMPRFVCFIHDLMSQKKDPNVVMTDLHFGTIPVRLFRPKETCHSSRRGIIFYHGGGGVFGSLNLYNSVCTFLVRETDSVLLSVGYRKLPGHCNPAICRDCLNVTIHFLKRLETYDVDPSRVVVCGESAGGGTVAQITQALVNQKGLPKIRAQVLIYPVVQFINLQLPSTQQNKNVPFLTLDFMMFCVCKYMVIDPCWQDAMVKGACIPQETWKKYKKWLSSDNIPKRFKNKYKEPQFPALFNEAAYLETKHLLNVENAPVLADDDVIAQLPEAFLVSCEYDSIRDDTLLYKKRLEDQGVPVTWYNVEDGFHGCIVFFDKKPFTFPCSLEVLKAVASYIRGI